MFDRFARRLGNLAVLSLPSTLLACLFVSCCFALPSEQLTGEGLEQQHCF